MVWKQILIYFKTVEVLLSVANDKIYYWHTVTLLLKVNCYIAQLKNLQFKDFLLVLEIYLKGQSHKKSCELGPWLGRKGLISCSGYGF